MILQRSRLLSHLVVSTSNQPRDTITKILKLFTCVLLVLTVGPAVIIGQEDKPSEVVKPTEEAKPAEGGHPTEDAKPAEVAGSDKSEPPKENPPVEVKPTIAIINAMLHPIGSAPIANGRILIGNDSIVAIGDKDLPIPEGIEIVDATGMVITPGWIDVASQLWMSRGSDEGASDGSLKAVDGLDPFAEDWKEVVDAGVTTVYVQPSSQGSMGGLGVALSVVPDANGKLTLHNTAAGLQMSLGRFASNRDRASRFDALKNGLQGIVDYKKKWDDYEEAVKKAENTPATGTTPPTEPSRPSENANGAERSGTREGESGRGGFPERRGGFRREGTGGPEGRGGFPGRARPEGQTAPSAADPNATAQPTTPPPKPKRPDVDPVKQRLLGVLKGEIPIRLEVHTANDAFYALELRKLFPTANWVLEDVDQVGSALAMVKESRLPIVLGSWINFSLVNEPYEKRRDQWKDLLAGEDGLIGISTQSAGANGSQFLREHVALACVEGLQREQALKSVTQDAAKLIGCDKKLGVLAPGYRADLVGFAGDPLDTSIPVCLVVCGGKVVKKVVVENPTVATNMQSADKKDLPTALPTKYRLHSSRVLLPDGYRDVTMTVDQGKVVAVEQGASGSGDAPLIELGDLIVTPSLESVYSTLGLENQLRGVDSNSAHLAPSDLTSLNLSTRKWIAASGLQKVALTTGSTNTLPGQISLFSLAGEGEAIVSAVGSKIVLSGEARSPERFPSSLASQTKYVRDALSMKVESSRLFVPDSTLDYIGKMKKEVLSKLLDRSQVALFWVTNDAEIEAALQLVQQYNLKAAFAGSRRWSSYAERLIESKVSLIVLPLRETEFANYMSDVADCHIKGIPVYFAGEHGDQLRLSAAKAVQAGVSEAWALQAITDGLQRLYAVDMSVGGIRVGSAADMVVWSGNPLDMTSRNLLQVSGGKVISEKEKR